MPYPSPSEIRLGGILLSLGALLTMICILLEVQAGWASLFTEMPRTDNEAGRFLAANWGAMRPIWTWSLIGNVLLAVASLLLLRVPRPVGRLPASLFWAGYFIGSLLLVVSFAISLGSYPAAFTVLEDRPYVFETVRGTPLYLFQIGALAGLSVFAIYFQQGFSQAGAIARGQAVVTLLLIIAAFVAVVLGLVSVAVFALACFLVPLLLGLAYARDPHRHLLPEPAAELDGAGAQVNRIKENTGARR